MPNRPSRIFACGGLALTLSSFFACSDAHPISLTAEDFRFVPDLVRVSVTTPLTLSVYNAGREIHEFDSPVLMYAARHSFPQGGRDRTVPASSSSRDNPCSLSWPLRQEPTCISAGAKAMQT